MRLYNIDGSLVADASPETPVVPIDGTAIEESVAASSDIYRSLELEPNEEYRVVASPVVRAGEIVVVLLTGLDRSRIDDPLRDPPVDPP